MNWFIRERGTFSKPKFCLGSRGEYKKLPSVSDLFEMGYHQQSYRYSMSLCAVNMALGENGF